MPCWARSSRRSCAAGSGAAGSSRSPSRSTGPNVRRLLISDRVGGASTLPRLLLHEAVLAIAGPRVPRALGRRSVAAAAGRLDQEHVALPDGHSDFLGLQDSARSSARLEPVAMG